MELVRLDGCWVQLGSGSGQSRRQEDVVCCGNQSDTNPITESLGTGSISNIALLWHLRRPPSEKETRWREVG
jgi:hypothetical protein